MASFSGPHNKTNPGKVTAKAHAAWSQRRAWHGETIKMSVFSEMVNDGVTVDIQVLPTGSDVQIDKVTEPIAAARAQRDYEIAWKDKPFADKSDFVLKAVLGGKIQAEISEPLYVDLDPPTFSA